MNARAIVGLFEPMMSREQRRAQSERFADQISGALQLEKRALAAVLVGGRRVVCAVPDSPNYQHLVGMRHSMLIGMYTVTSTGERIARDVEETISEYFDGCVIPTIIRV